MMKTKGLIASVLTGVIVVILVLAIAGAETVLGQPLEIDEAMLGSWEGMEVGSYGGRSVWIEIKRSEVGIEVHYNMGGARGVTAKKWSMKGEIVNRDNLITTTSQGYQHRFTLIDPASLKFENNFSGGKYVTVLRKVR